MRHSTFKQCDCGNVIAYYHHRCAGCDFQNALTRHRRKRVTKKLFKFFAALFFIVLGLLFFASASPAETYGDYSYDKPSGDYLIQKPQQRDVGNYAQPDFDAEDRQFTDQAYAHDAQASGDYEQAKTWDERSRSEDR